MLETVKYVGVGLIACLLLALVPAASTPKGPPVMTLEDWIADVHAYGCRVPHHAIGDQHECVMLRRGIVAAATRGALTARHEAFRQAADIVRNSRSTKAAIEALDRRASD